MKRSISIPTLLLAIGLAGGTQARGADDRDSLDYVPAVKDAPARRIASGSRPCVFSSVRVWILCPRDHVGLTTRESPAVYWYLSETTKTPVDIVLTPRGASGKDKNPPLAKWTLPGPQTPGLHKLDLAEPAAGEKGVKLETGKQYELVIEVVERHGAGSADPVAFCRMERTSPDSETAQAIRDAAPAKLPGVFAGRGIWFDALSTLNDRIDAAKQDPSAAPLRQARRKLLQPQGIIEDEAGKIAEAPPAK